MRWSELAKAFGVAHLVLVKSMARVLAVAAAFAVLGCASQLQITGPYADRLSKSDIRQITAFVTPKPKNVETKFEAIRPDKVRVTSRGYMDHKGVRTFDSAIYIFTATRDWTGTWHPGKAEIVHR